MTFESLANELLLDLFDYFNIIQLFRTFYHLNSRIDSLLLCHYHGYHLDFQSISKRNFDIICQEHLPIIVDQITFFQLTDDDETPALPTLFLSYGFTLDQFTRLKCLTLNQIDSFHILDQLMIQCQPLLHLTHLNLIKCCLFTKDKSSFSLINHIWSLRKLLNCRLFNTFQRFNLLSMISTTSASIRRLWIDSILCDFDDLSNLFQHTPNLRRLDTNISSSSSNQQLVPVISSITSLTITRVNFISSLLIIEKMPHLRHLTVKSTNIYLNGHDWEGILLNYLSNLQLFRLKMEFTFPEQNHIEYQVDQLLQTFRTTFWLEKHHCFVRCHSTRRNHLNIGVLYTLPYIFAEFPSVNEGYHRSTCPNEGDHLSYDHVDHFYIGKANNKSEHLTQFHAGLPNIRSLSIDLPYDGRLWSYISSFDRLKSLSIRASQHSLEYHHLQSISKQAPSLYSLKLYGLTDLSETYTTFFSSKTTSIRRLDVLDNQCHSNEVCITLGNSFLGQQCEVLLIEVEHRQDVLYLIKKMPCLRMLIFRCEYVRWNDTYTEMPLKNNELFTWLQNCLPCTSLFTRDSHFASSYMRLWIS